MEDIVLVGLNHKTASVEVREKLAFTNKKAKELIAFLLNDDAIQESCIISTCNRTEIYAVVDEDKDGRELLCELIILRKGGDNLCL